jgi:type I restriction enzyme, S subunit
VSALPDGWVKARLSQLGEWRGGGTPSKSNADYWDDGTVPWISPKDMKRMFVDDSEDHITPLAVAETNVKPIPSGSIAFVVRSGILNHTFPIAMVTTDATVNQDMRVLSPSKQLNGRWLLYCLLSQADEIRRSTRKDGVTVASIESSLLEEWEIGVPPREEQDRIVAAIERLFAETHQAAIDVEDAATLLDTFRASVIETVLRGGSNALPAEASLALAKAPEAALSMHAEIRYGWTAKAGAAGNARMLRITDIQNGRVDWDGVPLCDIPEDRFKEFKLAEGDIVFARTGATTGKSYLIGADVPSNAIFASYLIRVRPKETLDARFLALFFRSAAYWRYVREQSRGIGQPNVNGKLLGQLQIPIVSTDLQSIAAEVAEEALAAVSASEAEIASGRALAQPLQHAILRRASAGDLVSRGSGGAAKELLQAIEDEMASPTGKANKNRRATSKAV